MASLGPAGGVMTSKPVGPEKSIASAEVGVEARKTSTLDLRVPEVK